MNRVTGNVRTVRAEAIAHRLERIVPGPKSILLAFPSESNPQARSRPTAFHSRGRCMGQEHLETVPCFGSWQNPDSALKTYGEQNDALHADRTRRADPIVEILVRKGRPRSRIQTHAGASRSPGGTCGQHSWGDGTARPTPSPRGPHDAASPRTREVHLRKERLPVLASIPSRQSLFGGKAGRQPAELPARFGV